MATSSPPVPPSSPPPSATKKLRLTSFDKKRRNPGCPQRLPIMSPSEFLTAEQSHKPDRSLPRPDEKPYCPRHIANMYYYPPEFLEQLGEVQRHVDAANKTSTSSSSSHSSDDSPADSRPLKRLKYNTIDALTSPYRRPHVLDSWSTKEIALFEAAFCAIGKDFHAIRNVIRTKTTNECVSFYYMWKQSAHYQMWRTFGKNHGDLHHSKLERWQAVQERWEQGNRSRLLAGAPTTISTDDRQLPKWAAESVVLGVDDDEWLSSDDEEQQLEQLEREGKESPENISVRQPMSDLGSDSMKLEDSSPSATGLSRESSQDPSAADFARTRKREEISNSSEFDAEVVSQPVDS